MTNHSADAILNETLFPGNTSAYQQLLTFMSQGKITGFSGAGVSVPAFPTWSALLAKLLADAKSDGLISAADNDNYDRLANDPLELASALEEIFTQKVFRAKLGKTFASTVDVPTECQRAICELPLKGIVTLNYDDGHEVAYSSIGRHAEAGGSQSRSTLTRWLQDEVFTGPHLPVLHLHGQASDPEHMIFTSDDYDRIYSDELMVDLVSQLWRTGRLLVIGFGFADPILTRLSEGVLRSLVTDTRHFALIGSRSAVSALERRVFAKKYRLTPIYYEIRGATDGSAAEDHRALIDLIRCLASATSSSVPAVQVSAPVVDVVTKIDTAVTQSHRRDFERDLFVSPLGGTLYAEPRLTVQHPLAAEYRPDSEIVVELKDVLGDACSYFITAQPEYGATTFAKRVLSDLSSANVACVYKDAGLLPNYKRKLSELFEQEGFSKEKNAVLVLDNFDVGRDERLLKELIGIGFFSRFFVLVKTSFFEFGGSVPVDQFAVPFKLIKLAPLHRGDIRTLTAQFYDTNDQDAISFTVDKIYRDLVDLCIPITPSNVIMYLSVLYKEGDFNPINRVQIVGRYIDELLRRPSDAFRDSFSSRNKMNIVAAFAYAMFKENKSAYTEFDWLQFCKNHMQASLILFDERQLLSELTASRIFSKFGQHLAFKYRFFHSFFLGLYIAHHPRVLAELLADSSYLTHEGLVEVISELASDNNELVSDIVSKLNDTLKEFSEKFVPEEFDPFASLEWPSDAREEENLWKPLTKMVECGPRNPNEIDHIKRSIAGESRSANQQIVVQKFDQLERRLVLLNEALIDALANADSLDGSLKIEATRSALKAYFRIYQVGLILSPVLVKKSYFFWHGILFINSIQFDDLDASKNVSIVMSAMRRAVMTKTADQIGSRKLGEVYKVLARDKSMSGFLGQLNFACLLRSKPKDWLKASSDLVANTGQKEFYLRAMLHSAFDQYYDEVNSNVDRDQLKKLIATIRIKRDFKKDHPGESTVAKIISKLELKNYFKKHVDFDDGQSAIGADD